MAAKMYDSPHQFTPLLPREQALVPLMEKAVAVETAAAALLGPVASATLESLRGLTRQMNSYYSNRIEGQGTHPLNIARALSADFSADAKTARLQRLALAHIQAEQELEGLQAQGYWNPLASRVAIQAHETLYRHLPDNDRVSEQGSVVVPGQLRQVEVAVGRHVPPRWESVPRFLQAYDDVFDKPIRQGMRLICAACAHHRLVWVHPFADGNGRAVRLQTQLALLPASGGLWSINRGLARARDKYYAALDYAESPRQGDLDGRGNLSEKALTAWVDAFLDVCLDQVQFLRQLMHLDDMRRHIEGLVHFKAADKSSGLRAEAIVPLHYLFLRGEMPRGEFAQATGLGERTARNLIAALLKQGIVTSSGPYAPLRFGFPLDALTFLLPGLYPEAATPVV